MKNKIKIILPSDEKAASLETVKGWVSRNGLFFGKDERAARHDGSTHVKCEDCGAIIPKHDFPVCDECKEKRDIERYSRRERKVLDGDVMLYSDAYDEYFDNLDYAKDFCDVNECSLADLRLIICEPNYAGEIESDHWCDDLPEDGDLPSELADAIEELNKFIREGKIILSWSPGKFAVELS